MCSGLTFAITDHGITIGALSLGGHVTRRSPFEAILPNNVRHVPACNAYRQRLEGESDADFVARKAHELDVAFHEVGPETVCAFVVEPIVGAASGCIPAVPGYLKAMREVCDRYGALLIYDEGECGRNIPISTCKLHVQSPHPVDR